MDRDMSLTFARGPNDAPLGSRACSFRGFCESSKVSARPGTQIYCTSERVLVIKRIWPRKLSLNCSQRMVRVGAVRGFFEYCRSVLRDMGGVYLGPERYTYWCNSGREYNGTFKEPLLGFSWHDVSLSAPGITLPSGQECAFSPLA
ncbi:hypothetical protein NC651_007293 [Populus alba x Populus x berolinensis]|nr:hypothetical protein NC651_007293 [Populus alba x Populus x berolinensis]